MNIFSFYQKNDFYPFVLLSQDKILFWEWTLQAIYIFTWPSLNTCLPTGKVQSYNTIMEII